MINTTCMAHLVSQEVWKLFSTSRIKKACPYRYKKRKKKDSPKQVKSYRNSFHGHNKTNIYVELTKKLIP